MAHLHDPIFIDDKKVTIEFGKDREHRTVFEIVVNTYYSIDNPLCKNQRDYFRCNKKNATECIDRRFKCDHYPQCSNGYDESNCYKKDFDHFFV